MARFKKIPQVEEGKLVYADEILNNIVFYAVNEIPYVTLNGGENSKARSNAIYISKEKGLIAVDVEIRIHYTQSVSDMAFKVQEAIRHAIESMTERRVSSVNVSVCGVMFDEKIEENQNLNSANGQEG